MCLPVVTWTWIAAYLTGRSCVIDRGFLVITQGLETCSLLFELLLSLFPPEFGCTLGHREEIMGTPNKTHTLKNLILSLPNYVVII